MVGYVTRSRTDVVGWPGLVKVSECLDNSLQLHVCACADVYMCVDVRVCVSLAVDAPHAG